MDQIKFENLLGMHISVVEVLIGSDFENTLFRKSFYYISDEFIKKDFYGMPYNSLTISTNEKDTVQSITIHFRKLINRQFYDLFIQDYGHPDSTLVIEKRHVISESVFKEDYDYITQHIRKSEVKLREGTFEEGPLYIIWKKEGYQIKAFLRQQNMSEITFSL